MCVGLVESKEKYLFEGSPVSKALERLVQSLDSGVTVRGRGEPDLCTAVVQVGWGQGGQEAVLIVHHRQDVDDIPAVTLAICPL